jgi:hypothetical protein
VKGEEEERETVKGKGKKKYKYVDLIQLAQDKIPLRVSVDAAMKEGIR